MTQAVNSFLTGEMYKPHLLPEVASGKHDRIVAAARPTVHQDDPRGKNKTVNSGERSTSTYRINKEGEKKG